MVLFNNKKEDKKGVIHLARRHDKEGNIRVFGQILYDKEKYAYFHGKEVKKNA